MTLVFLVLLSFQKNSKPCTLSSPTFSYDLQYFDTHSIHEYPMSVVVAGEHNNERILLVSGTNKDLRVVSWDGNVDHTHVILYMFNFLKDYSVQEH